MRALHAGLQQPVAEHVSISYTVHATDKARVKHPPISIEPSDYLPSGLYRPFSFTSPH